MNLTVFTITMVNKALSRHHNFSDTGFLASAVVRDLYGLGNMAMLRPGCVKVRADNSACVHPYYVRAAAAKAGAFDFETCQADGENVRGVTKPLSVPAMHALAEQIRSEGGSIFFAAME